MPKESESKLNLRLLLALLVSILFHLFLISLVPDLITSQEVIKPKPKRNYQISFLAQSGLAGRGEEIKPQQNQEKLPDKRSGEGEKDKNEETSPKEKTRETKAVAKKEMQPQDETLAAKSTKQVKQVEQKNNFRSPEELLQAAQPDLALNNKKEAAKIDEQEKKKEAKRKEAKKKSQQHSKEVTEKRKESKAESKREIFDLTQGGRANVTKPSLVGHQPPRYPAQMRKRGIEGKVRLKVLISKQGRVKEVEVMSSSGYQKLDQAAREAVLKWQFDAAKYQSDQVHSWVLIPIRFKLN